MLNAAGPVLKNTLIICLLLNVLGCTSGLHGGQRLNLSPLLFYDNNPQEDITRLELFGPLFYREVARDKSLTVVAPFFYWLKDKESLDTEFLYPLGRYGRNAEGSRFNLLPFSRARRQLPEGSSEFTFFPVFWGKTAKGETYGGVFPLGGVFRERFDRDYIAFVLWPLYSISRGHGVDNYHFLWPFFSFSTGEETSHTFWPLAGKIIKTGVYEKYYALWPFISYQRLKLDTDSPRTLTAILPFYLKDTTPTTYQKGIFYPFFSHYTSAQGNYEQWDTPWPFFVRGQGEDFKLLAVRPFYYHREEKNKEQIDILWPMYSRYQEYSRSSEEELEALDTKYRFLFFSFYESHVTSQGKWEEKSRLWPLYFYEGQPGRLKAHAPDLLPLQSPGWDLLFGPYLYLWSMERQGEYRQGRALWGIYRWEEIPGARQWELSFLASRQVSSEGSKFKLLSGLFTYEKQGIERSLRLFYLPWGFNWQSK